MAIEHRPFVVPGAEDRADGAPELLVHLLRKGLAGARAHQRLVAFDQLGQVFGGQIGVVADANFALQRRQTGGERVAVSVIGVDDAKHDVAVHLDETPVAVVGESRIVREAGETGGGLIVQAEIENGIHHARHGFASAGTHRQQQRIAGVAEALLALCLQRFELRGDRLFQALRKGVVVIAVVGADVRGDGEAGRHRQTDAGHFRKVGAFAAEHVAHSRMAIGFFAESEYLWRGFVASAHASRSYHVRLAPVPA